MYFKNLQELPEEYHDVIEMLLERGIIAENNGNFEYPLSLDTLYLIKIMQRMAQ